VKVLVIWLSSATGTQKNGGHRLQINNLISHSQWPRHFYELLRLSALAPALPDSLPTRYGQGKKWSFLSLKLHKHNV
jgi:hypothetical protein